MTYEVPPSPFKPHRLDGLSGRLLMMTILGAWILLGKIAIGDWLIAVITGACLAVLFRFKVSNPLLTGATAVAGLVAFPILQPAWVFSNDDDTDWLEARRGSSSPRDNDKRGRKGPNQFRGVGLRPNFPDNGGPS